MFSTIQESITNILNLISILTTDLLNIQLFQIIIGIVLFGIVINNIYNIVKKIYYGGTEGIDYISPKRIKKFQKYYYEKTGRKISDSEAADIIIDNEMY